MRSYFKHLFLILILTFSIHKAVSVQTGEIKDAARNFAALVLNYTGESISAFTAAPRKGIETSYNKLYMASSNAGKFCTNTITSGLSVTASVIFRVPYTVGGLVVGGINGMVHGSVENTGPINKALGALTGGLDGAKNQAIIYYQLGAIEGRAFVSDNDETLKNEALQLLSGKKEDKEDIKGSDEESEHEES